MWASSAKVAAMPPAATATGPAQPDAASARAPAAMDRLRPGWDQTRRSTSAATKRVASWRSSSARSVAGGHGPAEGEKPRAAFLEMVPHADAGHLLRAGDGF